MTSDPNTRPAARYDWRMALDKSEVHRVPIDELSLHVCSAACPCQPEVVPAPEDVRAVLGPSLVPAVAHRNSIARALLFDIPDSLPLDLYADNV